MYVVVVAWQAPQLKSEVFVPTHLDGRSTLLGQRMASGMICGCWSTLWGGAALQPLRGTTRGVVDCFCILDIVGAAFITGNMKLGYTGFFFMQVPGKVLCSCWSLWSRVELEAEEKKRIQGEVVLTVMAFEELLANRNRGYSAAELEISKVNRHVIAQEENFGSGGEGLQWILRYTSSTTDCSVA